MTRATSLLNRRTLLCGVGVSMAASVGLGYLLNKGVNGALWEGVFGVATIVLVGSLVAHMWKAGAQMKREMESKLSRIAARRSWLAFGGVFLFTVVMITKDLRPFRAEILRDHENPAVALHPQTRTSCRAAFRSTAS